MKVIYKIFLYTLTMVLCVAFVPQYSFAQKPIKRQKTQQQPTTPQPQPKPQTPSKPVQQYPKKQRNTKKPQTQPQHQTPSEPKEDEIFVYDGPTETFVYEVDTVAWDPNTNELVWGLYSYKFEPVKFGTFTMGAPLNHFDAETIERPTHRVELFGFKMGATEVPQWLWEAVMGYNPSANVGDFNPVESVSFDECIEFINKLNELTHKKFDLPTESQWEYAAREAQYEYPDLYSGGNDINNVAWYSDNSGATTHEVGKLRPNNLNIFDMSGNVSEWCYDWFETYQDRRSTNPRGPETGLKKVYRSGSYIDEASNCRVTKRFAELPDYKAPFIGFRLVLSTK